MSNSTLPSRRHLLAGSAALGAANLLSTDLRAATRSDEVRPFRLNIPQEELVELRRRILVTRWPEKETVTDESQGVKL